MKYIVTICDKKYEIDLNGDGSTARINGKEVTIDHRNLRGRLHSILTDNNGHEFELVRANGGFDIWHGSGMLRAEVVDEKTDRMHKLMGASGAVAKASSLKAPMPGLILKVEVEVGQLVKKGDGLVVVEAMKMENELRAHAPASVKEIKVKPGQAVEKNQILIVFE
jgi:biotin carboxyl carrier protein